MFECDIAHHQSVCASAGCMQCPGHTLVYLGTASLQNLAVSQDFCSPLSVPLERTFSWCGTGGFQEQCQCFFICLRSSILTIAFYYFSLSLLSVYRLVLWGWGLWTDRVYTYHSLSLALPASFNNNNKLPKKTNLHL